MLWYEAGELVPTWSNVLGIYGLGCVSEGAATVAVYLWWRFGGTARKVWDAQKEDEELTLVKNRASVMSPLSTIGRE